MVKTKHTRSNDNKSARVPRQSLLSHSPPTGAEEEDEPTNDDDEPEYSEIDHKPIKKRKLATTLAGDTPNEPVAPDNEFDDASIIAPAPTLVPSPCSTLTAFEFYTTRAYPMNRGGYRYTACGPSLTSINYLATPIYRTIPTAPEGVRFAWEDRSPFVSITENGRTIQASQGWRAARGNISMREGNWYWEVKVERGGGEGGRELEMKRGGEGEGEGSWVRIGVGRRECSVSAPVGIDGHSYAYKDRTGDAVTLSRPTPYGKPFGTSSIIGIYLSLPSRPAPSSSSPDPLTDPSIIVRKRVPIRYKGQLYFESREYASSKEMQQMAEDPANRARPPIYHSIDDRKSAPGTAQRAPHPDLPPPRIPPKLPGSKLVFFLDGVCQGTAFSDLYDFLPLRLSEGWIPPKVRSDEKLLEVMENWNDDGTLGYYPIISVFGGGSATINPGPIFEFPPPEDIESLLRPPSATSTASLIQKGEKEQLHGWKSLDKRYEQYYAEQAKLDDRDELEALFTLRKSQSRSRPSISGSNLPASHAIITASTAPMAKRTKLSSSTNNLEADLVGSTQLNFASITSSTIPHPLSISSAPTTTSPQSNRSEFDEFKYAVDP